MHATTSQECTHLETSQHKVMISLQQLNAYLAQLVATS